MSLDEMLLVHADVGFILIAYNLRRLMNSLNTDELRSYLKEILSFDRI